MHLDASSAYHLRCMLSHGRQASGIGEHDRHGWPSWSRVVMLVTGGYAGAGRV